RGLIGRRQAMDSGQLGIPKQCEIVPVPLEKADKGVEVERTDPAVGSPILKRVPTLRAAQDQRCTGRVLKVVRIARRLEEPGEGSRIIGADGRTARAPHPNRQDCEASTGRSQPQTAMEAVIEPGRECTAGSGDVVAVWHSVVLVLFLLP